jgi:hypothetical protein
MILNIDFDYFVREMPNWDWQHAEFGGGLVDMLWWTRAQAFLMRKQDVLQETGFHHVTPEPHNFIETLKSAGFTFEPGLPIVASGSHVFAYFQIVQWMREGMYFGKILSFDAHHDMGYHSEKELRHLFDIGRIDCADWQYHLLRRYRMLEGFQIYPGWKGDRETRSGRCSWKTRPSLKQRFDTGVFSFDLLKQHAGHVSAIYLAKSEAWTPPWHDHVVAEFSHSMASEFETEVSTPFVKSHRERDPLVVREWDWGKIEAETAMLEKFFKEAPLGRVG